MFFIISGLQDMSQTEPVDKKKTPYAKPIPKNFQASWNQDGPSLPVPPSQGPIISNRGEFISLHDLQRQATAVVAFGNVIPVLPGSNLQLAIANGERAVMEVIRNEYNSG